MNGIVLKWRDTRDVRLLSTKHAPTMVSVERKRSANREENQVEEQDEQIQLEGEQEDRSQRQEVNPRAKKKLLVIVAYNKGKCKIDLSDQMTSYGNVNRKGVK